MELSELKKPGVRMAIASASVFFGLTLIFILHRYYSFYADFDQGIFNQVFWNGIHGRFFQSSLSSSLSTNVVHDGDVPEVFYHRLGQHFTPALLLWLPLYALFPSPATLSVLQVTLITAAGLVLYVLARVHVQPQIAALITASYYGANAVIGPTLTNFHDSSQLPLFVFSLLLAMEKRLWWLFWPLAVLILAIREDSGVILFGVGFYLVVSRRHPQVGLATCCLSFGYMLVLTNLIMPLFSEDISRRFMIERFGQYAEGDRATTLDIIWGIISQPLRLVGELFSPFWGTLKYLLGQWLPLAFIPALSGSAWAIAGFPFLKLFLGQGDSVLAINIRYALTVIPGLFYGTILWWGHRQRLHQSQDINTLAPRWPVNFRKFWVACIALSVVLTFMSNPNRTFSFIIPDSIQPWVYVSLPQRWQHVREDIRPLLAQVPDDASVSATTYLVPHLSGRREILRFPDHILLRNDDRQVESVDYVIADLWQLREYQVAFRRDRERLQQSMTLIDQMLGNRSYGLKEIKNGVILLQKGAESPQDKIEAWQAFRRNVDSLLRPPA
ncbi:DUF2079 domain-containing protein [Oscillatoria amoena NRMC-F 0135]|nr:DUF2079 domain-containing protein [Geitlerinema splendidum]MDL5049998.1 DUF2079 domain-containing protein [Oscillatoria amoena NRMC-F 0135]